jgi:tRNA A-37 threonylcarbamoyl transferase component Bud32
MKILLLGATEGLRYRLADMLAQVAPDSLLIAQPYPMESIASLSSEHYDVAIAVVGRQGEYLATLKKFNTARDLAALGFPTLALTEQQESTLAGRALISGSDRVMPLSGLAPATFVATLKLAMAEKARRMSGKSTKLPDVPGYQLLRQIGEGGMSKVYLAQRAGDDRAQVLKIIDPKLAEDETFVLRFARECKLLSRIKHENVVQIYDYSTEGNRPYLAMEYFAAGDLKSRIRGGLPAKAALKIMMQIAKAIDAVHTAGLVHRDLKPHNIMFRDEENLALVDFGLAKPVDPTITSEMQLTQDGMVLATPVYMSPEQCKGLQPDARGDIYSCGVILFELLAGEPPFKADNPAALAFHHVTTPIPKLPSRFAGFQPVVEKLLAKNPEDRFQSARELFAHIAI